MSFWRNQLWGPTDPSRDAGWVDPPPRKGFFTDTSICIGCKACEVACKEWNQLPMDVLGLTGRSYDNTSALGANTWRHVAFVEQSADQVVAARRSGRLVDLGMPGMPGADPRSVTSKPERPEHELRRATAMLTGRAPATGLPLDGPGTAASLPAQAPPPGSVGDGGIPVGPGTTDLAAAESAAREALDAGTVPDFRWLIASDVCKHCTHAGCLDVCPTGALFRTEFGTVVVQDDVCNGCGYCVAACPFGVIGKRTDTNMTGVSPTAAAKTVGIAQKCTLCYDRLEIGATPACAQTCPTTSIQFGDLDEMRARAQQRIERLHEQGYPEARLYGANPEDGVGGTGSIFLLLDEPEVYGLPPDPVVTTADLPDIFRKAGIAATAMLVGAALSFLGRRPV